MSEQRRPGGARRAPGKDYPTVAVGNGMEQARTDAVLAALGGLPADLTWEEARERLLPLLPRRRPLPPTAGTPLRLVLPPGIETGFGLDIGPAHLVVGEQLAGAWGVDTAAVAAQALANARERLAASGPADLLAERIDGVPVRILQTGAGCASIAVLLPDELRRILGPAAALVITPMRDLLVALPPDAPAGFAAWLADELASIDPNGLATGVVRLHADGRLSHRPLAD